MTTRRMRTRHLLTGVAALACAVVGGGSALATAGSSGAIDPARFSARVNHPLVPLASVRFKVFAGQERDAETGEAVDVRGELRVLDTTARIAGVRVAVVDVKEFEDGELVEHTLDYYAQRDDGSVWYFGERVDDYEDGKPAGHEGQWLAGQNGAKPGLFMPAQVKVGQTFEQERAPGVAEDRSTVLAVGRTVRTHAGTFRSCVRTKDFAPLDKKTEYKFYCRGVGLVREEASGLKVDLTRYEKR